MSPAVGTSARQWDLRQGDAREILTDLPAGSVQTVITSPPYWGLRDYSRCDCNSEYQRRGEKHPLPEKQGGVILQRIPDPDCSRCHGTGKDGSVNVIWGGAEDCEHRLVLEERKAEATPNVRWQHVTGGGTHTNRYSKLDDPRAAVESDRIFVDVEQGYCSLCPAWRGQLGLEPTPDLYVQHIVEVFREIRRVLRDDGTLWLNMGDCYAGTGTRDPEARPPGLPSSWVNQSGGYPATKATGDLKPKDLVGMPWRVAFALQADGWWLRSDIIWAKPNPMPESVTDRPTRAHENLFLFTKSGRTQYWTHRDRDGTRARPRVDYRWVDKLKGIEYAEKPAEWTKESIPCQRCDSEGTVGSHFGSVECAACEGKGSIRRWSRVNLWRGHDYFYDADAIREASESGPSDTRKMIEGKDRIGGLHKSSVDPLLKASSLTNIGQKRSVGSPSGRNRRSVWEIATQPYPEAHFATFPEALVEPCVKAGSSEEGTCSVCGSPWERVVEKERFNASGWGQQGVTEEKAKTRGKWGGLGTRGGDIRLGPSVKTTTTGFRPTCDHGAVREPSLVLDPFCGSGTAGVVAVRLGRRFLGVDIKAEYLAMAARRLERFPVRLDVFG